MECASELGTCAADCVCNGAIMTALLCLSADAGSVQSCFYPPIVRNASDMAVRSAGTCLQGVLRDGGCERSTGAQPEDSGDAPADAAGEAGKDSGESDSPAGD
jgi:hypothetical protein